MTAYQIASIVISIFISILISILVIIQSKKSNILNHVGESLNDFFGDSRTIKRSAQEERLQKSIGVHDNTNLLYKMDALLMRSGLRKVFPFLSTEVYIAINSLIGVTILLAVRALTGKLVFGLICAGFVLMLNHLLLKVLFYRTQDKVSEAVLHFANLMENFATNENDLPQILQNVYYMTGEPLGSEIKQCLIEINATGDTDKAFARMATRVGDRRLTELLQNLSIASRHLTNYKEVIKGSKEIIKNHLDEKAQRKELANNARVKIIALLIISFFVASMMDSMLGGTLIPLLINEPIGNAILVGGICILMFVIWKFVTIGWEADN